MKRLPTISLALICMAAACTDTSKFSETFSAGHSTTSERTKSPDDGISVEEVSLDTKGAPDIGAAGTGPAAWDSVGNVAASGPDLRTGTQILCQEGPRVVAKGGNADLSHLFGTICTGDDTNATFDELLQSAYSGTGDAKVKLVSSSTTDDYVTSLIFAYALKTPLPSPQAFSDIKVYEKLAVKGAEDESSKLLFNVESRNKFPGKGSTEAVVVMQDLRVANNAAVYDHRRIEVNNYLLTEDNRDLMLNTEHLLDPEKNEFYNVANGLLFGMKAKDGSGTYLVFLNELVIKNRLDTARLQKTMLDLARDSAMRIYEEATKTN